MQNFQFTVSRLHRCGFESEPHPFFEITVKANTPKEAVDIGARRFSTVHPSKDSPAFIKSARSGNQCYARV